MFRFLRDIAQFRHAGLHPIRHFVLCDARFNLRIGNRPIAVAIQLSDRLDQLSLLTSIDTWRIAQVVNGIAVRCKGDTLKSAGQKTAVPLPCGDRLWIASVLTGAGQYDETGKIIAFTAEPVGGPGTHAWST